MYIYLDQYIIVEHTKIDDKQSFMYWEEETLI